MIIGSIIVYCIALYLIFKYIKNDKLEILAIFALTIFIKLIVGDESFYPLFCMPVLLTLRYKKPYTLLYTIATVLFVNIMYGFGIWTIAQIAIYMLIIGLTYISKNILLKQNKSITLLYNFVIMFIFGVLMDVATFYIGNFLGYPNVFAQILGGLPFDLKYGLSGLMYGSLTMAVTYLSSVDIKEILKINKMTLEKIENN